MRYFIHLGFDGSHYHGWQFQPNVISVQEVLETALKKILKVKTYVHGCGRTDTGVHASQYVMHIDIDFQIDFDLKFRLNKNLPDDIAIYDIKEVNLDLHARHDARFRTYDYFIHLAKDPVLSNYSSFYELDTLDFKAMQQATQSLLKYTDFYSLCKQPDLYEHTNCDIRNAQLHVSQDERRIWFAITANRFVRSMIRLTVMFLLEIGKGKMSVSEFENMLENKLLFENMNPALPNGLYLSKIEYDFIDFEQKADFCSLMKKGMND